MKNRLGAVLVSAVFFIGLLADAGVRAQTRYQKLSTAKIEDVVVNEALYRLRRHNVELNSVLAEYEGVRRARSEKAADYLASARRAYERVVPKMVGDFWIVVNGDAASERALLAVETMVGSAVIVGQAVCFDDPPSALAQSIYEVRLRGAEILARHLGKPGIEFSPAFGFMDLKPADNLRLWKPVYERLPAGGEREGAIDRLAAAYVSLRNNPEIDSLRRAELAVEFDKFITDVRRDSLEWPCTRQPSVLEKANQWAAAGKIVIGNELPVMPLRTLDGKKEDSLLNYRNKIVLMDFWATWCGPCRKGHPALKELANALKGQNFEVIAVSVDQDPAVAQRYVHENSLPFVHWHMQGQADSKRTSSGSDAAKVWSITHYPTYILLDGDGVVLARTSGTGFDDKFKQFVREQVQSARKLSSL